MAFLAIVYFLALFFLTGYKNITISYIIDGRTNFEGLGQVLKDEDNIYDRCFGCFCLAAVLPLSASIRGGFISPAGNFLSGCDHQRGEKAKGL